MGTTGFEENKHFQREDEGLLQIAWHNNCFQKIHNSWMIIRQKTALRSQWECLNPEYRKPFSKILSDMHRLIWRYDCKAKWMKLGYFKQHLWRNDVDIDHYVIMKEWMRVKIWLESGEMRNLLRRKSTLWQYLKAKGFPVPERLGMLSCVDGSLQFQAKDGSLGDFDALLSETKGIFVKPDCASEGKGCAKILRGGAPGCYVVNGVEKDLDGVASLVKRRPVHVERLIVQHPRLEALHPASINTLRMVTMVCPMGGVELNFSVLRMGVKGRSVDNWCKGGLAVCLGKDGCLTRDAWFQHGSMGPCTEHPDTHVVFEGYEIPYFDEAVDMVLRAHRACPGVFGLGWDVAITLQGPLIIETNVRFAIFQPLCGGLRSLMEQRVRPLAERVRKGEDLESLIFYEPKHTD